MQDTLKIYWLQYDIIWHQVDKNLEQILDLIRKIPKGADIVFLPETFTTGFSNDAHHLAEKMDGLVLTSLSALSAHQNIAIAGSLLVKDHGKFFNRFVFIHPTGQIDTYDKRHLFTLAGENQAFDAGKNKKIIEFNGWRICPMICYDLRFPVWCRNDLNYDLLTFVANWPKPRVAAWDTLLQARAIENQSYVLGVNRVGRDENGLEYVGHSGFYDYAGKCLQMSDDSDGLFTMTISHTPLVEFRRKLDFLADRDSFSVQ